MKKLVLRADKLVSDIIKALPEPCCCCNRQDEMDPGHYLTRTWKSTRWDFRNVHRQCRRCNILHEQNEQPMRNFMEKRYSLDKLARKSRELCKRSEVEEIIEVLVEIKTMVSSEYLTTHEEVERMQELLMGWESIRI